MLATYANNDTWPGLVRGLAERLSSHGLGEATRAAVLCCPAPTGGAVRGGGGDRTAPSASAGGGGCSAPWLASLCSTAVAAEQCHLSFVQRVWRRVDVDVQRLSSAAHPATLCWVAAGCVDEAVAAWTFAADGDAASVDTLQARPPPFQHTFSP